jgi:nucleoside-diphosphate-sugar epimerase
MTQGGNETVVVGADGTLGALLVERLEARGVKLRCTDMAAEAPLQLDGASTVINAAGPRARPGLKWADYLREHLGTTRTIVSGMRAGSHLIHLSSTAVYGARGISLECDSPEAPLLFPMAAYASAKYAAELAVRALCEENQIKLTVLRLSMVYGSEVDSALDSLRRMAARGLRLMLKPQSLRQHLLNIDLLVHGIKQACQRGPSGSKPLILADPFFIRNAEINDAIARIHPTRFSVSLPLDFFKNLSMRWSCLPEFKITMPFASLAVLAIDNEFAWQPAFEALGLDSGDFSRERTFDRYLQ